MEFLHIFTKPPECNLWSTLYPEDDFDIFKQLFDLWSDTEYLFDFFTKNQELLSFWENMSVDDAIERCQQEAQNFSDELWAIETGHLPYQDTTLKDIFEPLHEDITSLNWENEAHRKGKPDVQKPMIRLYGIELEDGCIIITGGAIKLTRTMDDSEKVKLKRVQKYLEEQKITSREGLIN